MYEDPGRYFGACQNCGACCSLPGIFLPEQIGELSVHLKLRPGELFRKYLVAELFTPRIELPPVFILSPAKATDWGSREMNFLRQGGKTDLNRYCLFRDRSSRSCVIHQYKPFGCAVLICGKMTRADAITLNKTYYYHRWLDEQTALFGIFPELGRLHGRLVRTISSLPIAIQARQAALSRANTIIGKEMAELMNGEENERLFYRLPE